MKSISASIVVLSGSIIFSAGAWVQHGDTQAFVMCVGGIIAIMGLVSWLSAKDSDA